VCVRQRENFFSTFKLHHKLLVDENVNEKLWRKCALNVLLLFVVVGVSLFSSVLSIFMRL
jgi:hypothetical protein